MSKSPRQQTATPLFKRGGGGIFQQGFTLIELVIVICIVGILAATLLNRIGFYQDQAEKAAMQQVAAVLQSALTMRSARLLVRGQESEIAALEAENPMNWLAKVPGNYAGEYYEVTPRAAAPGNWAFDLKTRELVYIVNRSDYFTPGKDGHAWVRYHVRLLHESTPGVSGKPVKELAGVLFEPVEPYQWFE